MGARPRDGSDWWYVVSDCHWGLRVTWGIRGVGTTDEFPHNGFGSK